MSVDVQQNPFSLYDFLGYLIPGATAIYAGLFVSGVLRITPAFATVLDRYLSFSTPEVYVPLLLAAYVVGHLFSYLSSVTVEIFANYAYGYPSKYLLGKRFPNYWRPEVGNEVKDDEVKPRTVFRIVLFIVLAPISVTDFVLEKFLKGRRLYARRLDSRLARSLRETLSPAVKQFGGAAIGGEEPFSSSTDFFRFLYHMSLERAQGHANKFQNYVALYGFMRTMSLITVCLFWFVASSYIWLGQGPDGRHWVLVAIAALSFLLYMGFVKFYRRFTLEVFMALAAVLINAESA